ncbi:hypothetical protein DY000_02018635 [Brassica cretica]|uniref:Uncharacterized protein n=1 Tax=Brassica cretica TaxID=69181 RepID=A0ABQ7CV45_BRACR|nr:hypothetical protein DY000_02018635 [Brassica cretica]
MIVLKRCELLPTAKAAFADGRVETSQVLKPEFKKILREILSYGGGGKDLAEIGESYGVLKAIDKAKRVINCPREVEPECDILSPSPKKVDAPKEFKCTLSKKIMIEPVIIASEQDTSEENRSSKMTLDSWVSRYTRISLELPAKTTRDVAIDNGDETMKLGRVLQGQVQSDITRADKIRLTIIEFRERQKRERREKEEKTRQAISRLVLENKTELERAAILWKASSVSGLEVHRRDLDFNSWIFCCLGFSEAGCHSSSAGQSWVFGKSDGEIFSS